MAFVVTAKWQAKPGEADPVAAAIKNLMEPSKAEPGNRFYQVHRSPEDDHLFFFYEQYDDEAAYKAHGESEHFNEWGHGTAIPLLESRERAFYETWDG
jgi:quinol monooxygenase YgiN